VDGGPFIGRHCAQVPVPLYSYADPGAGFTSTAYPSVTVCDLTRTSYQGSLQGNLDAWMKANMYDPIAGIEAIPGNWGAAP